MSLREILNAREERWLKKQTLAAEKRGNVISLSLRMPASLRVLNESKAFLMHCADKAEKHLQKNVFLPERVLLTDGADGPGVVWLCRADKLGIKAACVSFEDETREGELADLDVMGEDGEEIPRSAVGKGQRKCIVCGNENARKCIFEKIHTPSETISAAEEKIKSIMEK